MVDMVAGRSHRAQDGRVGDRRTVVPKHGSREDGRDRSQHHQMCVAEARPRFPAQRGGKGYDDRHASVLFEWVRFYRFGSVLGVSGNPIVQTLEGHRPAGLPAWALDRTRGFPLGPGYATRQGFPRKSPRASL